MDIFSWSVPVFSVLSLLIIGMMFFDRLSQRYGDKLGLGFSALFLGVIVLSVILHAIATLGFWSAFIFLGICAFVPYVIEIVGVHTGFPFGKYEYGKAIGPKLPFGVPVAVAGMWMIVLYCSFILAHYFGLGLQHWFGRWSLTYNAISISIFAVLFDTIIEPVAVEHRYWSWERERIEPSHTTRVHGYIGKIPVTNYIGWFITSLVTITIACFSSFLISPYTNDFEFVLRIPVVTMAMPILWGGSALWYLSGTAKKFKLNTVVWMSRLSGTIAIVFYFYLFYKYVQRVPLPPLFPLR